MLLQGLVEQARHLEGVPPEGYALRKVRWAIELDGAGRLRLPHLVDLAGDDDTGGRGKWLQVPDINRTSGTAPILAVDRLEYVLGVSKDPADDRAAQDAERKRSAFEALTRQLAERAPDSPLAAVAMFLRSPSVALPDLASAQDWVAFRVDGAWVHDDPRVRSLWQEAARGRKTSGRSGTCLVCGKVGLLADTIPAQLPIGVVPNQGNQLALVSMNKPAHGRAGATGLQHTPICSGCASTFMASLTALLRSPRHRRRSKTSETVLTWWLTSGAPFDPFDLLDAPGVDDPSSLLDSLQSARPAPSIRSDAFRAILGSANAARFVVRRWIDLPLVEVYRSIGRWFDDHRIASSRFSGDEVVFPLWRLAAATGRWDRASDRPSDPAHGSEDALAIAAIEGSAPPVSLVAVLLARLRADHHVTDPRAALLRLSLSRNRLAPEETTMPGLNDASTMPAYVCGRLLAVIDGLQHAALPGVNVSVADKVIGRASIAPGSILPKVLGDSRAHLKKLRRLNPGAAWAIEQRIDVIADKLGDQFPAVLTLPEQGQFFLGFHHQKAFEAASRRARRSTTVHEEGSSSDV